MQWYRLYFVGEHGKIMRAENIEASDDAAARAFATGLNDALEIEIWELARKVGVVPAGGLAAEKHAPGN